MRLMAPFLKLLKHIRVQTARLWVDSHHSSSLPDNSSHLSNLLNSHSSHHSKDLRAAKS